jgi:hypothetical protein
MAMPTLDDVLRLVEQLSPEDQQRLRARLTTAEEAARAAQRTRNQAAIAALDALAADKADTDDTWWPTFAHAIDADRTSDRLLYPESES